jgi:hypothetical protein
MTDPTLDASIPVLTEIISAPPAEEPALSEEIDISLPDEGPIPELDWGDEEKTQRLEFDIRERILSQVMERIDDMLEQRIRDSLADVLQTSVQRLANDIGDGLRRSLREVVSEAVAREMEKHRPLEN